MPSRMLKSWLKRGRAVLGGRWLTRARLARELHALGVRPGGVLLVHSSLSALGYVPGGAATVIAGLEEVLGSAGTLVMPTHSWDRVLAGGTTFDVGQTPSCVGTITEVFRTWPGVVRSLHPTHSVAARGPRAAELIAGHERAESPCGEGSPYTRLVDLGAQVLFLGCGLEACTLYHACEARAGVPYLLLDGDYEFELSDAQGQVRTCRLRRLRGQIRRRCRETRADLAALGLLRAGPCGMGEALVCDARPLAEWMIAALRAEPGYLLASDERASDDTVADERVSLRQGATLPSLSRSGS